MSEIINLSETQTNEEKKNTRILHCYKCDIIILKKFGSYKICQDCKSDLTKKYYDEVIKPKRELNKQPRKKKTFEVDYITPTGEKVIVVLKSENKQCKKCNEVKHYQEFQHMKDKIHKNIFYLNPRCKKCCGERQCMKNKDVLLKLIEDDINTQQL